MPLPKYYCDYCDRSFHDTPSQRRKHFETRFHKQQVKMHYDSFKVLLAEQETGRPVCHSFYKTGFCEFGVRCRYSHVLPGFQGSWNVPEKPPVTDLNTVPLSELPPSLWPPREEDDYDTIPIAEWG